MGPSKSWLSALVLLAACEGDDTRLEPLPPLDAGVDPVCTRCGACEERFQTGVGIHREGNLDYAESPPVAGDHNPTWANWGVHDEAVREECFVHNLEHGGIVFLHNCAEGCPEELAQLEAFVEANPVTLLSPYPALEQRFAVLAWGARLVSDCFDLDAFEAFRELHNNRGPESLSSNPSRPCE